MNQLREYGPLAIVFFGLSLTAVWIGLIGYAIAWLIV